MKKELQFIGRRAFSASIFAVVFVAVAGTSLWALAAFTEPTTGPVASIQDFATNVLGANNADNSFDSSSVTANADGSVLERLEALEGPSAITAEMTGLTYSDAIQYCENFSGSPEITINNEVSEFSGTYTDWRLPTVEEIEKFGRYSLDDTYLWTSIPYSSSEYRILRLSNNSLSHISSQVFVSFRCVR